MIRVCVCMIGRACMLALSPCVYPIFQIVFGSCFIIRARRCWKSFKALSGTQHTHMQATHSHTHTHTHSHFSSARAHPKINSHKHTHTHASHRGLLYTSLLFHFALCLEHCGVRGNTTRKKKRTNTHTSSRLLYVCVVVRHRHALSSSYTPRIDATYATRTTTAYNSDNGGAAAVAK